MRYALKKRQIQAMYECTAVAPHQYWLICDCAGSRRTLGAGGWAFGIRLNRADQFVEYGENGCYRQESRTPTNFDDQFRLARQPAS